MKNLLTEYSQEIFKFIKENEQQPTNTTPTSEPNAEAAPAPEQQAQTPAIDWDTFSKKLEAFKAALNEAGFDSIAAFLEAQSNGQ